VEQRLGGGDDPVKGPPEEISGSRQSGDPSRNEEMVGGAGDRSRGAGPASLSTSSDAPGLAARVRAAHADLAQRDGRLRAATGGGALELPGIRLMASGLQHPQWNNGDVTGPADVARVDLAAVRGWFAERGVPWGIRVPQGMPWPYGRRVLTKRAMALPVAELREPAAPSGVLIRVAGPADLDTFARVDAAAFEEEVGPTAAYARPMLGAEGFRPLLATADGVPAGVAYGIVSTGAGGHSVGIFGVGVLPEHRRRGIGAALTVELVRWARDEGADLAWLNPDDDRAARLYARLGFREVSGFDVYVDA
jgi:ribosomal protein S18 acetylase RimI-like enzyme